MNQSFSLFMKWKHFMILVQCKWFDFTLAEVLCEPAECPDNWLRHADSYYLFLTPYMWVEWIDAMVSFLFNYCRFLFYASA